MVSVGMAHGVQKVLIVCFPGQGDEPGPLTLASAGSPVSQTHVCSAFTPEGRCFIGLLLINRENQFGDRLFAGFKLQLIENKNVSVKILSV